MSASRAGLSMALAVLLVAVAPAWADDCRVPVDVWQPRSAVHALAQREGWHIERLKIDDGCYEIRGHDAEGRRFKAKLDPATLEVVKIKRAREGDHHRDRERERETTPPPPTGQSR